MAATKSPPGFKHRFISGTDPTLPPLLLLHGTGGNEDDLMPLGEALLPGASRLSPRGQVLENGAPRFFRRLAEGVFDLDDLKLRTQQLADFVEAAGRTYHLTDRPVAVGFSNGANIAAALLLLHPEALGAAVLFRAMVPLVPAPLPTHAGTPVLICNGRRDPLVAPAETERLAALLTQTGAKVTVQWQPAGHELTPHDVHEAKRWLDSLPVAALSS